MRRCPKCRSLNKIEAESCWHCKNPLGSETAARAPAAAAPPSRPPGTFEVIDVPEVKDTSQPWEVWVIILLIAVAAALNVAAGRMVSAIVGALVILGLFKRSNLTWWFVTGVNLLGALVYFSYAAKGDRGAWLPFALSAGAVALLISCRARHAY
jgi:hypothetical protein